MSIDFGPIDELIAITSFFSCYHPIELEGISCAPEVFGQPVHLVFEIHDGSFSQNNLEIIEYIGTIYLRCHKFYS
jgi:hypothetical protein